MMKKKRTTQRKKIISYTISILILVTAIQCGNSVNSTKEDLSEHDGMKQGNNQEHIENLIVPIEYNASTQPENQRLSDKLFFIGWSVSGKFAYIIEQADEACDCFAMRFIIQNMATRKTEWEWNFNDKGHKETMLSVWKKNMELFNEKMKAHEIIQQENFDLLSNPFTYNESKVQFILETTRKTDEASNINYINSKKIYIEKNTKKIELVELNESPKSQILGAYLKGFITNPFAQQSGCLILQKERRGFEGPPHVTEYEVVGFDLSTIAFEKAMNNGKL